MAEGKITVSLEPFEQQVLVQGLNRLRKELIKEGQSTEDVDDVLLKFIDAQPVKKRREEREDR